jgi:ariadne-1
VCTETLPKKDTLVLKCNCRWCFKCIEHVFSQATKNRADMPPKCCEEINPVHYGSTLRNRLPKRLVDLYNLKRQEFALKRPMYCPAKDCGEWIQPSMIKKDPATGRAMGTCPKCRSKSCYQCRAKWHSGKTCEQTDRDAILNLVSNNQRFQRCYRCKTVVEISTGCSHMVVFPSFNA